MTTELQLSVVTKEMAEKLIEEVQFEDRLVGVMMSGTAGNQNRSLYSLEEVVSFIQPVSVEFLSQRGKGTMNYVNIEDLLHWIRNVYKDKELADIIEKEMIKENSVMGKLNIARHYIQERLNQCKQALS